MKITLKANGVYEDMLRRYFEEFASDMLAEKINTGKKTFAGCWAYITGEARKEAKGSCACIPDEKVYGWATHYFEEDDIPEQKTGVKAKVTTSEDSAPECDEQDEDNPEAEKETKKAEGYIDLSDFL